MIVSNLLVRAPLGVAVLAAAGCAAGAQRADTLRPGASGGAPESFYVVTAELARARGEPRVAALQYAAAARLDPAVAPRAAQVAAESLQPSLALRAATQWLRTDPAALDAHRIAAQAALALDDIDSAAEHYRALVAAAADTRDAEFSKIETELRGADNVFGARRVADRLAVFFPDSAPALRLRGFCALRADDPPWAVRSFEAALAQSKPGSPALPDAPGTPAPGVPAAPLKPGPPTMTGVPIRPIATGTGQEAGAADSELNQALLRARVLAGDVEGPLAQARETAVSEPTPGNRLDYVMLLLAAKRTVEARALLTELAEQAEAAPVAHRLLALLDFDDGKLEAAGGRFTELLSTGRDVQESFYYLGLIAERHDDFERALRLYARVESGENLLPAMLRAAAILHAHGEIPASDQLLERLADDQPDQAPAIASAHARLYADAGDSTHAMALLDLTIEQYPDDVDLRFTRASWFEEEGRVDASLHELQQIYDARPGDPAAWNALGYTLADHSRQLSRARGLIERAYAAAPRNAAIRDSMGWVLYRQGHTAEALPFLSGAYADERGGDIAAHLGEVLWRLDRHADAERIWDEAAALDADDRLLKATRTRLHAAH